VYITGASRGIGEAIGLKCAKDGANVSFDRISFNPEKQPSVFKISLFYVEDHRMFRKNRSTFVPKS
jgi:NAD(P)-dependent dehydrogenase (short-subunit alcohol dehydrogenase family)